MENHVPSTLASQPQATHSLNDLEKLKKQRRKRRNRRKKKDS